MKLGALFRADRRTIPLADAAALRRQARRTVAVRAALAVLAVTALASAIFVARDAGSEQTTLFAGHESGVIVVDLSASIGATPHARIGRAFRQLVKARASFGLVLFSDVAYEAVPPGTRWPQLQALLRFFTPPRPPPRDRNLRFPPPRARQFLENPFAALRGGTRISTGLNLAQKALQRDGDKQSGVLLVSDLDNSLFDMPELTRTLGEYRRAGISLRVLGLSASREDAQFFERVVGKDALVQSVELAPRRGPDDPITVVAGSTGFPTALAAASILLLLLLGANEQWCSRLRWRDGAVRRGRA